MHKVYNKVVSGWNMQVHKLAWDNLGIFVWVFMYM